jgi:O-methyltransferase
MDMDHKIKEQIYLSDEENKKPHPHRRYMSSHRLLSMYFLLYGVLRNGVEGEIVELGCFKGRTSAFIASILKYFNCKKEIHVYDSFEGLPQQNKVDKKVRKIEKGFLAATIGDVKESHAKYDVPLPTIHKGWFQKTLPQELPNKICFSHLDSDYYDSIKISLKSIYCRLSPGAIVQIDDYNHRIFPGVTKAVNEFMKNKPEKIQDLSCHDNRYCFFEKE